MLTITDQQLAALEAAVERQQLLRFTEWYIHYTPPLPPLTTPDEASRLWQAAKEMAVPIEAEGEARLQIIAAAIALMPDPRPDQWLLAIDVVFERQSDIQKLGELIRIRDMPR